MYFDVILSHFGGDIVVLSSWRYLGYQRSSPDVPPAAVLNHELGVCRYKLFGLFVHSLQRTVLVFASGNVVPVQLDINMAFIKPHPPPPTDLLP